MTSNHLARPMFLFDADCGVCQKGTDTIRSKINPPVNILAYQSIDYAVFGVTPDELSEGPVFIDIDGTHQVGPLGMAMMLTRARRPYRFMGKIMLAPGLRQLLHAAGPTMYRHRGRLPGATGACSVPPRI